MSTDPDARTRRTALRIVAFLGVLVALSCLGAVVFFQSTLGEVQQGLAAFDANVRAAFPEGTVWQLCELTAAAESRAPTDGVHLVLCVGLPEESSPTELGALQDTAWDAYLDAFPVGGLHLGSIAIGTAAGAGRNPEFRLAGHVSDWEEARIGVPALEERTGRTAPPDLAVIRWFGNAVQVRDGM